MRFIPGSGTMVRGIKKLPPAHVLVYENGNISLLKYWTLSFAKKLSMSHDEYIEGLEHKFQETVAVHLAEDGATGAFLSGGLDSSLIVAMMAREAKDPVPTFSISFAEKEFNEITHARVVSERFGTKQYEAQADTDLIKALPTIISGLGEPSDPVAVSFFTASRLAAEHVKVVLGGDGGNELFAGCDRYRGVVLSKYYSIIPAPIRQAIVSPLINVLPASFGYNSLQMKLRWFERMAGVQGGLGEILAEAVSFFRFGENEKAALMTKEVRQQLDPGSAAKEISDRFYESDAGDPIEKMLYTDYCTRLPEHLLMLVDRMGMVHSLEVRSPLVDKELVEYMAMFPLNMKVRGQKSRYIWYKLAERLLPESIAKRKKRGFRFPLAYWFAVKLNPFLHRVFDDSSLIADSIFNKDYIIRLLEEHRSQKVDHNWKIWMLLNLEIWYRLNIQGFSLDETQEWIERQHALSSI
jgi:asparagine synthase (glutamine-hydrolysing)